MYMLTLKVVGLEYLGISRKTPLCTQELHLPRWIKSSCQLLVVRKLTATHPNCGEALRAIDTKLE